MHTDHHYNIGCHFFSNRNKSWITFKKCEHCLFGLGLKQNPPRQYHRRFANGFTYIFFTFLLINYYHHRHHYYHIKLATETCITTRSGCTKKRKNERNYKTRKNKQTERKRKWRRNVRSAIFQSSWRPTRVIISCFVFIASKQLGIM